MPITGGVFFAYCLNNPFIYIDPTGQKSWLGKFTSWVKKGWDEIWDVGNQFARWADQNGLHQGGVGYNTALGPYHYLNETGNVYHSIITGMNKAHVVTLAAINKAWQSSFYIDRNSKTANITNVFDAGVMALLRKEKLILTGSALNKVKNSPATTSLDKSLVKRAMNDPKFGSDAFSFRYKQVVEFGGQRAPGNMKDQFLGFWKPEYRDTWKVASNELTWLIRHASVSGWVQVNASGNITIQHNLYDVLDLSASPGRTASYNKTSNFLGYGWHTVLGASSPSINSSWRSNY